MSEPTIGDTVQVLDVPTIEDTGYAGMVGTVLEDRPPMMLRYFVQLDGECGYFRQSELQKVFS